MRSESQEEDTNVNIVLQSGIPTGDDKGKQPKDSTSIHKDLVKEAEFDLERTWETFMEALNNFTDASTSRIKDKSEPEMNWSMLTMFLETCMKPLRDSKVVKGLQELINICVGTMLREPHIIRKIRKHKTRMRREMRLTTQIEEYDMDQVILDLGLDANFLPK